MSSPHGGRDGVAEVVWPATMTDRRSDAKKKRWSRWDVCHLAVSRSPTGKQRKRGWQRWPANLDRYRPLTRYLNKLGRLISLPGSRHGLRRRTLMPLQRLMGFEFRLARHRQLAHLRSGTGTASDWPHLTRWIGCRVWVLPSVCHRRHSAGCCCCVRCQAQSCQVPRAPEAVGSFVGRRDTSHMASGIAPLARTPARQIVLGPRCDDGPGPA